MASYVRIMGKDGSNRGYCVRRSYRLGSDSVVWLAFFTTTVRQDTHFARVCTHTWAYVSHACVAHRVALFCLCLSLLVIFGPFLVPESPSAAQAAPEELAGPESRFVDVPYAGDTLTVHYEEAGQGESALLLLLHGFAASTFSWREVLPALGQLGRTVAFDRPAFGLTERPMPESWQGDWMRQNPYPASAQVGTDRRFDGPTRHRPGGAGRQLGGRRGGDVDRPGAPGAGQGAGVHRPGGLQRRQSVADPALALQHAATAPPGAAHRPPDPGLGENFARSAWHDPTQITDEIWAGYLKPLQVANWDRALWELTAANAPTGLPERLAELTLPVLVITGDDDRIVPTAQSIQLAGELPNAELVVVPACGHVPHEECPQAVLDAIQSFLAGLEGI